MRDCGLLHSLHRQNDWRCKKTVMRLVVEAGASCSEYQDEAFRNLNCRRIQVDETWSFCLCKQKNVTPDIAPDNSGAGDAWLWVAIDADTKVVLSWLVGQRDSIAATALINLKTAVETPLVGPPP